MIVRFILALLVMPSVFAVPGAPQSKFVKVYIEKLVNHTGHDYSVQGIESPSDEIVSLKQKFLIPFISIKNYLREYATKKAFTPAAALRVTTQQGVYRIWASESGVMCARDPQTIISLDTWKAKKLLGITEQEHLGKKAYYAALAFRIIKNKLKISLEPTGS